MKIIKYFLLSFAFISVNVFAQEEQQPERKSGHNNENKFKQLYEEFSTPNMYRTASGAPGPAYYQQQADYKMDIVIDDDNAKLTGSETITYTNNSPDQLKYLWVQLDQNMRAKDSKTPLINGTGFSGIQRVSTFTSSYLRDELERGFNIQKVKGESI